MSVEDWRELNRNLFSAMFLEKVAMFVALLFVVLVASFGVLASNLMSVLEKSQEIAILKAMGGTGLSPGGGRRRAGRDCAASPTRGEGAHLDPVADAG